MLGPLERLQHAKRTLRRRSEGILHVDRGIHPRGQSRSIELSLSLVLLNRTFRRFAGSRSHEGEQDERMLVGDVRVEMSLFARPCLVTPGFQAWPPDLCR